MGRRDCTLLEVTRRGGLAGRRPCAALRFVLPGGLVTVELDIGIGELGAEQSICAA
jgi:hypothetical protein